MDNLHSVKRDYDIDLEPCDYLDCFSSVDL